MLFKRTMSLSILVIYSSLYILNANTPIFLLLLLLIHIK